MSNTNPLQAKVVLLGESGVGKSSLISRMTSNVFPSNVMVSTGASFATKDIAIPNDDRVITMEIWDTAGQERYRSLARVFYKNAAIILLVYDITNKRSFIELKNYWVKEVQEHSTNSILGLIGNKSDIYQNEQVTEKDAKAFAKSIDAFSMLVSAKSANGIEDLLLEISRRYLNIDDENNSWDDITSQKLSRDRKTVNNSSKCSCR